MRIILFIIFGAIAYFLFPSNILGVPFSQLSTGDVWKLIGAVICALIALKSLWTPKQPKEI